MLQYSKCSLDQNFKDSVTNKQVSKNKQSNLSRNNMFQFFKNTKLYFKKMKYLYQIWCHNYNMSIVLYPTVTVCLLLISFFFLFIFSLRVRHEGTVQVELLVPSFHHPFIQQSLVWVNPDPREDVYSSSHPHFQIADTKVKLFNAIQMHAF